jgi:antitoxin HicB
MTKREKRLPTKDLDYYLKLRYTIILISEEDGWGALALELPGCVGGGDTIEEALRMLDDAKQLWLTYSFEEGCEIPEPLADPHALVNQWRPLHLKRG